MAKMPPGSVALVSVLANAEGLSVSYLAKIFQDLAKAGLVRSHRGAKGGFSLARPPAEITLIEIIEAIEGPIALNRCLVAWEECEKRDACGLYPVLAQAQEQLTSMLRGTSLQALAEGDHVEMSSAG